MQNETSLIKTDKRVYTYGNDSAAICEQAGKDLSQSYLLSTAVSYLIIGINYILRIFIIGLIKYIGKATESE